MIGKIIFMLIVLVLAITVTVVYKVSQQEPAQRVNSELVFEKLTGKNVEDIKGYELYALLGK